MSIIFGISTTHILSGVIRSIYRGQLDQTHFIVVALLAVFVNRPLFHLGMAWYLLLTTLTWSLTVRWYLV